MKKVSKLDKKDKTEESSKNKKHRNSIYYDEPSNSWLRNLTYEIDAKKGKRGARS